MSRYLFHPKALPVSNLFEAWKEEFRTKNLHVVPPAPVERSEPARGIAIGVIIGIAFWGGIFLVRWIIRLCS